MASPQGGFPPGVPGGVPLGQQLPPQPQSYEQQPQAGYEGAPGSEQPHAGVPSGVAGGRKKRAYAGQAYEFGVGGNAGAGGQQPIGQDYSAAPGAAPYGAGYPQQSQQAGYPQAGQPSLAYGVNQPVASGASAGYGLPPHAAAIGGYQAPDPSYPGQGVTAAVGGAIGGAMAGVTNQLGQMGLGGAPQGAAKQPIPHQNLPMNQLYPTDLLSQPFSVAELDLPPPPLILPPNVSSLLCLDGLLNIQV